MVYVVLGAAGGLIGDYLLSFTGLNPVDGIPGHLISAFIGALIVLANASVVQKQEKQVNQ